MTPAAEPHAAHQAPLLFPGQPCRRRPSCAPSAAIYYTRDLPCYLVHRKHSGGVSGSPPASTSPTAALSCFGTYCRSSARFASTAAPSIFCRMAPYSSPSSSSSTVTGIRDASASSRQPASQCAGVARLAICSSPTPSNLHPFDAQTVLHRVSANVDTGWFERRNARTAIEGNHHASASLKHTDAASSLQYSSLDSRLFKPWRTVYSLIVRRMRSHLHHSWKQSA